MIYGVSIYTDDLYKDLAFSGSYNFAYPQLYSHTGTDEVEGISGRSLVSYGRRSLSGYPSENSYVITPHSVDFDNEAGSYVGIEFDSVLYPPQYEKQLYYYDLSATLTFVNELDEIRFSVPLIEPSIRFDFYEWSKLYFPSYNFDYETDEMSALGRFIANTLSAFINFHIFPASALYSQ